MPELRLSNFIGYPTFIYNMLPPGSIPPFELIKKTVPKDAILECYDAIEGRMFNIKFAHPIDVVVLRQDDTVWMSDTPYEVEGISEAISRARGRVLIGGLGIGLFPVFINDSIFVKRIDIVELHQEVADLVFRHIRTRKMRLFIDDIYHYLETTHNRYDFIYLDIWAGKVQPIEEFDKITQAAQRCLASGGEVRVWLQELVGRVKSKLPTSLTHQTSEPGVHEPCLVCSKTLRFDYAGLCSDCAFELGIERAILE